MESGGGGDTSPVSSNGEREQPVEGGDMTPVAILGRINELSRQILVELNGDMTTEAANLRAIEVMQQILDELDRAGVRGPAPTRTAGQDLHFSDGRRFVPASSEAMARLPETTVAEETREEDECAVCLKSFEEGDRLKSIIVFDDMKHDLAPAA
ncbi:hypothetical protein HU200_060526 [Digitaria exilis]|uniref:Uncharacterized protein n=1 Tax=Digitaria exilis TaxID=1010633 RepID=A0A835A973_9POAL|nr:hypothetical protein HU200_060526 [Digitaria exilis]